MLSPISAVASPLASTKSLRFSPAASRIARFMPSAESSRSGLVWNAGVGTRWLLTTAWTRPGASRVSASSPAATTMSQPRRRSAPREAMRTECRSLASSAMRIWVATAPFFCDSPVMSSTEQPLPSRCAAMPRSAPTVTTPVPPMPVTRMP